MDIEKCMDILNARPSAMDGSNGSCPCHTAMASLHITSTDNDDDKTEGITQGLDGGLLSDMATIHLMNLFTTLQGERVQAHLDYNHALNLLCKEDRLGEYPILCAEATSRFAVISKKILVIKDIFLTRGIHEPVVVIAAIQTLEKEKLTLIAAQHLDQIHLKLPSVAPVMHESMSLTPTETSRSYAKNRITQIENDITVCLEEFQGLKCDYLDDTKH